MPLTEDQLPQYDFGDSSQFTFQRNAFAPVINQAPAPAVEQKGFLEGTMSQAYESLKQTPGVSGASAGLAYLTAKAEGLDPYAAAPEFNYFGYQPNFRVPTAPDDPRMKAIADLPHDQQEYVLLHSSSDGELMNNALLARRQNKEQARLQAVEDQIGGGAKFAGNLLSFAAQAPLFVDAGPLMGLTGGARAVASGLGGGFQVWALNRVDQQGRIGENNAIDNAFGIFLAGGLAMGHSLRASAGSHVVTPEPGEAPQAKPPLMLGWDGNKASAEYVGQGSTIRHPTIELPTDITQPLLGWDGPVIRAGTDVPQPQLREGRTEQFMSDLRQGQMATAAERADQGLMSANLPMAWEPVLPPKWGTEVELPLVKGATASLDNAPSRAYLKVPGMTDGLSEGLSVLQRHLNTDATLSMMEKGVLSESDLKPERLNDVQTHQLHADTETQVKAAENQAVTLDHQITEHLNEEHRQLESAKETVGEEPPVPKSEAAEKARVPAADIPIGTRIRSAYKRLTKGSGEKVGIHDLIADLAKQGVPEADVEAGLRVESGAGRVKLFTDKNAEEGEGFEVGGKERHQVSMKERSVKEDVAELLKRRQEPVQPGESLTKKAKRVTGDAGKAMQEAAAKAEAAWRASRFPDGDVTELHATDEGFFNSVDLDEHAPEPTAEATEEPEAPVTPEEHAAAQKELDDASAAAEQAVAELKGLQMSAKGAKRGPEMDAKLKRAMDKARAATERLQEAERRADEIDAALSPEETSGEENPQPENYQSPRMKQGGSLPSAFRKALVKQFGERGIAALEKAGILKIVFSEYDLPLSFRKNLAARQRRIGDVQATHLRGKGGVPGTVYIMSRNADVKAAGYYLLHEIGEHYGLEPMLGEAGYEQLQQSIRERVLKGDDPEINRAWNQVLRNYSHLEPYSKPFMREVIAHLADAKALDYGWLKQAALSVRSFLRDKLGVPLKIGADDVRFMLSKSLRQVMSTAESLAGFDRPSIDQSASDVEYALRGVGATAKDIGLNPEKRLLFQAEPKKGNGIWGYLVNNPSLVLRGTGVPEWDVMGAKLVPSVQGGIDSSSTTGKPSASSLFEQKSHGWQTEQGVIKDSAQAKWFKEQGIPWIKQGLPKTQKDFDEAVHQEIYQKNTGSPAIREYVERTRKLQAKAFNDAKANRADGTDNISASDTYARRVIDFWKYDAMQKTLGEQGMIDVLAGAMQKGHPSATPEDLQVMATAYHNQIMDRMAGASIEQMFGLAATDRGRLSKFMQDNKVPAAQADAVAERLSNLKHVDTGGVVSPLKHRIEMDESHQFNVPGQGTRQLSDLFSHDRTHIDQNYLRLMAGASSFAEAGWRSELDFINERDRGLLALKAAGVTDENLELAKKHSEMVYKQILGKPMGDEDFSTMQKAGRVLRTLASSASMGMSGFSVANNVSRAFIGTGFAKYGRSILNALVQKGPDGGYSLPGMRELQGVVDTGRDHIADEMFHTTESDSTTGKFLNGAQQVANRLNWATMRLGLMQPLLQLGKSMMAVQATQRIVDNIFNGESARSVFSDKMWAAMNITPEMADRIQAMIEKHSPNISVDEAGMQRALNFSSWEDREARTAMLVAIDRTVNTQIHGDDIAAQTAFMNSPVGRIVTQLRRFPMMASTKQFGRLQNQRDAEVIRDFFTTAVVGLAAYAARTGAQAAVMPEDQRGEFLDQRLSAATLAAATFSRSPYPGMFGTYLDTALGRVGLNHFLEGTRSSEGSTDILSSEGIPLVSMVNGLSSVASVPVMAARGQLDQHEGRALRRVTPLANTIPGQAAFNALINSLPKKAPQPKGAGDPYLRQLMGDSQQQ